MFLHKIGSVWEINSPAKLNLYLDVLGRRADGFHDLETLLVPVRIYDQLRWEESSVAAAKPRLRIRNLLQPASNSTETLSAGDDNLICRAISLLAQAAGVKPRGTFDLTKRIPIRAGLGGGSSDAAAALLLANTAWGIGYSRRRLANLAAEVGSDIPFFLGHGPAVCTGRGEIVETVHGLPPLHFVLVKPPESLSTAEVFEQWGRQRDAERHSTTAGLKKLIELLRSGALAKSGRWMVNRLESAAAAISPWIDRVRAELAGQSFCGQLMTGSGSACFGLARSATQARRAARLLSGKEMGTVFVTSNC